MTAFTVARCDSPSAILVWTNCQAFATLTTTAAAGAIITGGYLWHLLYTSFGTQEQVLAFGALCAILAIGAQAALCGPALQQNKKVGNCTRA